MSQKRSFKSTVLFFALFLLVGATLAGAAEKPRNIIFLIGDGMGIPHITAARIEQGSLEMARCKTIGIFMTCSLNDPVTDSAAAGTALATGHKTNNDMVGLLPDGTRLKNLMEYARESGKSTGITVTSIIPHATPAAFSAHHTARYHYDIITSQQVESGLDVMIGGGWNNFYPRTFAGSRRKDDKDMMHALRQKMPVVTSIEALRKAGKPKKLAAILSPGHLDPASKRNYTLGELTRKAIDILNQNEKGFVLMVEGSQIDLASHDNDMARIIAETRDFDTAVKEAVDFAEADGNTLVVITADHETGGLSFPMKSIVDNRIVKPAFSSDNHTAAMCGLFATGPGSSRFAGMYDNTDVAKNLIELVK
jgi:alkaline phosphatase